MKVLNFKPNMDWASLLLRVSLGGMDFLRGIGRPLVVGMEDVISGFVAKGFPIWTAYASTIIEIIGGIMLLLGTYTRFACLLLLPVSVGILVYHLPHGWVFHNAGGGWEYPQLIVVGLLATFMMGGGRFAVISRK